jgi:hypothetical protein
MRSSCASLSPQYSPPPPMPCSSLNTLKVRCPSGYRIGSPTCAQSYAKEQPGGWEQAGEKGREGAEKRKKFRVAVWHEKTGNAGGARAYILNGKAKWFYHSNLSSFGTVQSTLGVGGCGRETFASFTCQRRDAARQMCSGEEYILPYFFIGAMAS